MKDCRASERWLSIDSNLRRRRALSTSPLLTKEGPGEVGSAENAARVLGFKCLSVLLAFSVLCTTAAHAQESPLRPRQDRDRAGAHPRTPGVRRAHADQQRPDTISLQNVDVAVEFADEAGKRRRSPPPTRTTPAPLFFIRLDSMDGISDVSGSGTVAPYRRRRIRWLIIPAPARGNQPQGKRYQVGATPHYTLGGEQKEVEVAPDWITVTPQPRLVLDYFLTLSPRSATTRSRR